MSNKTIIINSSNSNNKNTQVSKYYPKYLDISMESIQVIKTRYINTYETLLSYEDGEYDIVTEVGEDIETNFDLNNIEFKSDNIASESKLLTKNKFQLTNLKDLKAIFNSLHNIFHWIPGERILNPEFGSKLYMLLYNGITDFTSEQIMAEIRNCVTQWEPRVNIVKVVNVSDINDTENNTIRLDIIFTVPSLNNDQQYVYSYNNNKFNV